MDYIGEPAVDLNVVMLHIEWQGMNTRIIRKYTMSHYTLHWPYVWDLRQAIVTQNWSQYMSNLMQQPYTLM